MFQKLELDEHGTGSNLSCSLRLFCSISIAAMTIGLIAALAMTEKAAPGLQTLVSLELPRSGVENPVTAVLLNFRSYDTLLEVAVLLIVAIAMLPNVDASGSGRFLTIDRNATFDPVLAGLLRWLVPATIVMAGYMLWTGAYSPGGAFHAGALLAGAGVLISLSGQHRFIFTSSFVTVLLTVGLAAFLAVGVAVAAITGTILQYPEAAAGLLILLIECAATLSIAAILLLLYNSLAPRDA